MHSKEKKVEIGRITTTTKKPKVYIFYFEKKEQKSHKNGRDYFSHYQR